jgi:hypothetical protein
MRDRPSTLELVSLRQAVLWIALGLEPLEERFEALEDYPRTVDRDDPQHPLSDAQKDKIKAAKKLLGRQLIEGGLAAYGRLMTYELTELTQEIVASGIPFEQLDPDALDRPRVVIPAKFWRFDTIGWDEGWTGSMEAAGS